MSAISGVELAMWTPAHDAPRVRDVADAMETYGFQRERAENVPEETAFRRAIGSLEVAADKKTGANATKATFWRSQPDKVLHGQLDELIVQDDRVKRETLASWSMAENGDAIRQTGYVNIDPAPFRENYTWADVSKVIQTVLTKDGLGAYTPKKSGGVYFVPVASVELLDRLERAAGAFGLNFIRFQVPDTHAARMEVADAIFANMQAAIEEHRAAIASYQEAVTKPGIVRNRIEALAITRGLIRRVAGHLAGRDTELNTQIDALAEACDKSLTAIEAYRPAVAGKRQIMFA